MDIIMLCYEYGDKTRKAIESILTNTNDINLCIVNKKQSVSQNRNEFMKRKLSDWFVMCDDDIQVIPGWLEALKAEIKDGIGIITSQMLYPDGKQYGSEQCSNEGYISSACGALMLMRNIGLLADEHYIGSQWEDTDLCMEYKRRGYKIISTHKTNFFHDSKATNAQNEANYKYYHSKWA